MMTREEKIAADAAKAFEHHVAMRLSPGVWKCAAPGTWTYGYMVAFLPSCVVVWGDIGELMLRPMGEACSAAWALGSRNSIGYMLSKVPRDFSDPKEFDAEAARADLIQHGARPCDLPKDITPETWYEGIDDLDGDVSEGPPTRLKQNALFCVHALRWLLHRVGDGVVEA
jgi:hypothetical protein